MKNVTNNKMFGRSGPYLLSLPTPFICNIFSAFFSFNLPRLEDLSMSNEDNEDGNARLKRPKASVSLDDALDLLINGNDALHDVT